MGKLHTLRRAIERNPEEFFTKWHTAKGARQYGRGSRKYWQASYWHRSHKAFVKKTLIELGYDL